MYQIVCFSPSVREDSITVPSFSSELDVTLLTFRRLPLRKGRKEGSCCLIPTPLGLGLGELGEVALDVQGLAVLRVVNCDYHLPSKG